MVNEAIGANSAEDQEAIRLAKARLVRVCRLTGLAESRRLHGRPQNSEPLWWRSPCGCLQQVLKTLPPAVCWKLAG